MPPIGLTRAASRASVLLVVLLLLASCGGGDGGEGARPTISPTRTPTATATLPSPELPSITAPRPAPAVRNGPALPARPGKPTARNSPPPPAHRSEPTARTNPSPREARRYRRRTPPARRRSSRTPRRRRMRCLRLPRTKASRPGCGGCWPRSSSGPPSPSRWAGAGTATDPRRRDLAEAEGELAWFARELLPELRQVGSREQVAGGWTVGQTRVAAAEDRLTVLESLRRPTTRAGSGQCRCGTPHGRRADVCSSSSAPVATHGPSTWTRSSPTWN